MIFYTDIDGILGHGVRIVLAEKDINCDVQFINSDDPPEDVAEANPYGTSLTLMDRDLSLFDAQIIMEYLDERFPHPPLMPVDPVARANNRQLRYRVERDLCSLVEIIQGGSDSHAHAAKRTLRDHLTAIAPVFQQQQYFLSDEFSLADCCIIPLLWRLDHYRIKLPASAKGMQKYALRQFARPAFRISLSEQERQLRNV
ncbi:MAG: glutathione S-transferase N-terminal domain-containing protein [Gammaproteobacteria bacterium]|nr:glutathione S-transferase N-terminal domain-containing protein [Gammaproteobacteria bacterium]